WGRALWSRVKVGCQVRVADIAPDWTGAPIPRLESTGPPGRGANPLRGRSTDQRGGHLPGRPDATRRALRPSTCLGQTARAFAGPAPAPPFRSSFEGQVTHDPP